MSETASILISLSVALISGLLLSRLAKKVQLPAVTAYLVAGVLIGPYCVGALHIDGFGFSSGAGAWGTFLDLNDDGTFSGEFHDSNMGETGEGYPYGTVYVCDFSGKFSEPEKINEYTYSISS